MENKNNCLIKDYLIEVYKNDLKYILKRPGMSISSAIGVWLREKYSQYEIISYNYKQETSERFVVGEIYGYYKAKG